MADNSKIEWTDATWNPIRAWLKSTMIDVPPLRWGYHCERISPGCKHCYASTMNGRMLPAWSFGLNYAVSLGCRKSLPDVFATQGNQTSG